MRKYIYEWENTVTYDWGLDYWFAKNYRTAKKELTDTYKDDLDIIIKFIAEIRYEDRIGDLKR